VRSGFDGGTHVTTNGLLLRRDIHSLSDRGYVTITPELRFEVSRRIKDEFENGRHYYALHGANVSAPGDLSRRPHRHALTWHNEHRYLG
jgi:putative restriction endonuclease